MAWKRDRSLWRPVLTCVPGLELFGVCLRLLHVPVAKGVLELVSGSIVVSGLYRVSGSQDRCMAVMSRTPGRVLPVLLTMDPTTAAEQLLPHLALIFGHSPRLSSSSRFGSFHSRAVADVAKSLGRSKS